MPSYAAAVSSSPHVVVIQFGTNDVLHEKFDEENFTREYLEIITTFKELPSKPSLYLNIPPPAYNMAALSNSLINVKLPQLCRKIAILADVIVIDVFTLLGGSSFSYPAAMVELHPNELGYLVMAHEIAATISKHENFTLIHHHTIADATTISLPHIRTV